MQGMSGKNPDIPRAGRFRMKQGGTRRGCGAERGRAGQDADGSFRPGNKQASLLHLRASKTVVLNLFPDARTNEMPAESKTRTYRGRVGSRRRTAVRRAEKKSSRMGRRRIGPPRRQPSRVPSKAYVVHNQCPERLFRRTNKRKLWFVENLCEGSLRTG